MPQVKVARRDVSADQAAATLRAQLGDDVEVNVDGSSELKVRRGFFSRATVTITAEPDGTLFDVKGSAQAGPLVMFTLRYVNNRGIGERIVKAIAAGLDD